MINFALHSLHEYQNTFMKLYEMVALNTHSWLGGSAVSSVLQRKYAKFKYSNAGIKNIVCYDSCGNICCCRRRMTQVQGGGVRQIVSVVHCV